MDGVERRTKYLGWGRSQRHRLVLLAEPQSHTPMLPRHAHNTDLLALHGRASIQDGFLARLKRRSP
jgi:hypothetical protein